MAPPPVDPPTPPGVASSAQDTGGATTLRARRAVGYEGERPEVQALVPRTARRVLELGCASGALGAALGTRQPVEVVGVELDPRYAADAEGRLDRVVCADVEELLARPGLEAELGRFDCLIAADVLEHLRDPWSALARAASLLDSGGFAIVSLPNARSWRVLMQVFVRGRWPQRDSGIFDRTHLRWFTLGDALDLLRGADLEPAVVSPCYWETGRRRWVIEALRRTPVEPLLPGQYVLGAIKPPTVPAER